MLDRFFLDTSFVIALINKNDQFHDAALSLSYQFENSFLVTTNAVLLEIGNALAKKHRREAIEIIRIIQEGRNMEIVEIERTLFEKGMEIYTKFNDKSWGLVDCISFAVMREKGIVESLTFDRDFEQAGFQIRID